MENVAGIDWASEAHEVCVVAEGGVVGRWAVSQDEGGISTLCRKLGALEVRRVAIERPDGILVERLLETGLTVIAIHPNQLKAARDRYAVAHGKSDRFDAFVLAELARTDVHRFRAIRPDSDETKALRALTRSREDLVEARVELANQLRAQLEAFWPGAAVIFAEVDSPIALAFLARYPSPGDARRLGPARLGGFLARHGYSGRRGPEELLARLRSAPRGTAGGAELEARKALGEHPDAAIFAPLFQDRKTAICPATLIAELGDSRDRYPTDAALAADGGMSPVAVESGKRRVAIFRRACDKRLRVAIATLADSTRHWHPWARAVYRRARARGQDHPHAIRTLGRRWVRVLWRCWTDRMPYDPSLHGGFNRLLAEGG